MPCPTLSTISKKLNATHTAGRKFECLKRFDAFELVDASSFEGVKVLSTGSVEKAGKALSVAKHFEAWSTDEYFAQATTMATHRLIDVVAMRRKHSRLVMDIRRASLHLEEEELVLSGSA